jgi:hypothetical protein
VGKEVVNEVIEASARSIARDLVKVMSADMAAELAQSLRAEEPSGALGTGALYFLDALEEYLGGDWID